MKTHRVHILIVAAMLLTWLQCYAVTGSNMSFRSYKMEDGISSNRINCIIQNSKGFIWIGTNDGLNRFDGTTFKNYYHNANNSNSISCNIINSLLEDDKERIWIGTRSGIDIYDPVKNLFYKFDYKTQCGRSVKDNVVKIIRDKKGNYWIGSLNDGIFHFNPKSEELTLFSHNSSIKNSLPNSNIWDIYEDYNGVIWVGTSNAGLLRFNSYNNTFVPILDGYYDKSVYKIINDSYGNLWVGTYYNGIIRICRETGEVNHYLDRNSGRLLYHIHDIMEYSPGQLLITSDNGLTLFNVGTQETIQYKSSLNDFTSIAGNELYSLYRDREQNIWIGSYFDGIQFSAACNNNFEQYSCRLDSNSIQGKIVNALCEDDINNLWVGTDDNGIFYFDIKTKRCIPFLTAKDAARQRYCVHELLYDDGYLWVGTYANGLDRIDVKRKNVKNYRYNSNDVGSIVSNTIHAIFKATNGCLYIGTDKGLCYYNPIMDKFTAMPFIRSHVTSILEDELGVLWIATVDNGLIACNIKDNTYKHYQYNSEDKSSLCGNTIMCMTIDRRKRLWLCSDQGAGFCEYDYKKDKFIRYDHIKLPSRDINSVVADGKYLWFTTKKGIIRFDTDTEHVRNYTKANGLVNELFSSNAVVKSVYGNIYMGNQDGFCEFTPQDIVENTYNAPIVFTEMSIFNTPVSCNVENSPLKRTIEYEKHIVIPYSTSVFGFEFASLSYVAPKENIYSYKLEGFDEQWNTTDSKHQKIGYTNLLPGEYTLRLRGSNSDKYWSNNEAVLRITVKPPFFRTYLAYVLYILLLSGCVCLLIKKFVKRSKIKYDREIAKINSEKEKKLYKEKIEFFTNIIHEIRTPLTLILGPLEHIVKSSKIKTVYGDYLDIIEQNQQRMLSLVNQLLDFRKVESGAYTIKYTRVNIRTVVQDIAKQFMFLAHNKHVGIDVNVVCNDDFVIIDSDALIKIISNLLANAIKYAHTSVVLNICNDKNEGVRIEVSDDGDGIPINEREKIFELFYRVRNTDKTGVGVGLHLTKGLVEMLGGKIYVEDKQDVKGCVFVIEIPNNQCAEIDNSTNSIIESYIINDDRSLTTEDYNTELINTEEQRQYSIMVVDDNYDICNFLNRTLSSDYFVIAMTNAIEALEVATNNHIDLIVSDVVMPKMNGSEFCERIKVCIETSHIPFIMLTAKTDIESRIEGLDSGADAYIEKPFSIAHLKAQINNLIQQRLRLRDIFVNSPLSSVKSVTHSKADYDFMTKFTKIIHEHISEPDLRIDDLSEWMFMSRTSLYVKIKALTLMTPTDFTRLIRLKEASRIMSEGETRVNEICFKVGFNSPSYFAKCFQKQFGILPTEFINNCKQNNSHIIVSPPN